MGGRKCTSFFIKHSKIQRSTRAARLIYVLANNRTSHLCRIISQFSCQHSRRLLVRESLSPSQNYTPEGNGNRSDQTYFASVASNKCAISKNSFNIFLKLRKPKIAGKCTHECCTCVLVTDGFKQIGYSKSWKNLDLHRNSRGWYDSPTYVKRPDYYFFFFW